VNGDIVVLAQDLDWSGVKAEVTFIPVDWVVVTRHEDLFIRLHNHLPKEMIYERELLICRL
jgi:phosphoenolpyruvate carboxykinase (GTP)